MIVFKRAAARPLAESWELRQVLEELRREQAKIPNVGGHVFTRRNGRVIKNVREAWLKAVATGVRKKQLPDDDFRPHDLRRSAITFGVPRDVVMAASGHKPNGVHDGYVNFSDAQLIEAFSKADLMAPPKPKSAAREKAIAGA